MKIAIIHSGNSGFFPRFYKSLANAIEQNEDQCILIVPNSGRNRKCMLPNQVIWGTYLNWFVHFKWYKLTGLQDIFSIFETINLLHILNKHSPDVIHFNLINDKCLHIPLLVHYVNRRHIPIVWTMHDCRAFTGQCSYFDEVNCDKWKSGCGKCSQCETWIDNTHWQWKIRQHWHTAFNNLTIVTPSHWLASFVRESMFKMIPVKVIYNGVDISKFSHKAEYDVRRKYNISTKKKIVLGCAINWEPRKGMTFFEQMSEQLPNDYQIILVGGINEMKKQELSRKNIICTGRTSTFGEMLAWYQAAAVFCNPTLADNFPTTNIESLAAGTPIVTFRTGGSPEAINEKTGIVVEQGNLQELCNAVQQVSEHRDIYTTENCIERSLLFSSKQYGQYIKLYHSIIKPTKK